MLADSYWVPGIPLARVKRLAQRSFLVAAIVGDENQVLAYARVVSDGSRVAYLADVIVHPDHRGVGLGQKVVGALMKHRSLRKIDLWLLLTKDAHGLYRKFRFHALENPERLMVLRAKG